MSDNKTAFAYINKQVGTKSKHLFLLAKKILIWCRIYQVLLVCWHLARQFNLLADSIRWNNQILPNEWSLYPVVNKGKSEGGRFRVLFPAQFGLSHSVDKRVHTPTLQCHWSQKLSAKCVRNQWSYHWSPLVAQKELGAGPNKSRHRTAKGSAGLAGPSETILLSGVRKVLQEQGY